MFVFFKIRLLGRKIIHVKGYNTSCTHVSIGHTKCAYGLECTVCNVEKLTELFFQTPAQPREVMTEVLNALRELNVRWKKNGHYNMKCRWVPVIPGCHDGLHVQSNNYFSGEPAIMENDVVVIQSANVLKFEIQVSHHVTCNIHYHYTTFSVAMALLRCACL